MTFGTYFGEIAFYGEKERSVNIEALEKLICYKITMDDFRSMQENSPELALAIMNTIGKTLTDRLRDVYKIISELET